MKLTVNQILSICIIFLASTLIIRGAFFINPYGQDDQKLKSEEMIIEEKQELKLDTENKKVEVFKKESNEFKEVRLDVPFVVQAPTGDWGYPFDSACEEASMLMLNYYFTGQTFTPMMVARDIQTITDFEINKYGFHEDTNAEQTAQLIRDYYDYKVDVFYNITLDDIREQIDKGNPVIVPTTGRTLGNIYFVPPGPIIHMIVIIGYTETDFIVNDPGTIRGAGYIYSNQIISESINDWTKDGVAVERSAMIIVKEK